MGKQLNLYLESLIDTLININLTMKFNNYKNLFNLSGKTAIITGGLGLLGKHFCKSLAEFGANIAVVDIDLEKAIDFAKSIEANYSVKSKGYYCNVSDSISVNEMVDRILIDFGKIDILHNNAAAKSENLIDFFTDFENYKIEEWNKIMSVNIDGMFLVAQAVGKSMINLGVKGSIVQSSSIYGIMGPDNSIYTNSLYLGHQINTPAVYSTSKAAVIGLSKYLATYWANFGIRVNTITPGGVESGQNKEFISRYSSRIPLGRMAFPEEMTGALIYLVSDASSYVTGQNLIIDGGLSAW